MDALTGEVRRALRAGLYYVALVLTLTLPDVCAALESVDGTTSGRRYRDWFQTWLSPRYSFITGDDMWSLRCGLIHQGRFGHPNMQYGRVIFTIPSITGNVLHQNVINDALNLDTVMFCMDVIAAVDRWYQARQTDEHVQANWPRLFQYRDQGLPPYMVGIPLIA